MTPDREKSIQSMACTFKREKDCLRAFVLTGD